MALPSRAFSVVNHTFASRTSWVASTCVIVTKPSRGSESRATASASTSWRAVSTRRIRVLRGFFDAINPRPR